MVENRDRLKLVGVDSGNGCVTPSDETIADGSYTPLSRPLFFYVKHAALERPAVRSFVEFIVETAPEVVPSTGYLALSPEEYAEDMALIEAAAAGN